jgi:hypothetical protein
MGTTKETSGQGSEYYVEENFKHSIIKCVKSKILKLQKKRLPEKQREGSGVLLVLQKDWVQHYYLSVWDDATNICDCYLVYRPNFCYSHTGQVPCYRRV